MDEGEKFPWERVGKVRKSVGNDGKCNIKWAITNRT